MQQSSSPAQEFWLANIVARLAAPGRGEPAHGIAEHKLDGNPYGQMNCVQHAALPSERYVVLLPLALLRTQDDKGAVRHGHYLGVASRGRRRPFGKVSYVSPREDTSSLRWTLYATIALAYGVPLESLGDLAAAGFCILPYRDLARLPRWPKERLPNWTAPYLWQQGKPLVNGPDL